MTIRVFSSQVSKEELFELAKQSYGNMVKGVVDLKKQVIALGGDLHADAEQILLDKGSRQEDLWGFNIWIDGRDEYLQYNSMINIRPRQGNRSPNIENKNLRNQIKEAVDSMVKI